MINHPLHKGKNDAALIVGHGHSGTSCWTLVRPGSKQGLWLRTGGLNCRKEIRSSVASKTNDGSRLVAGADLEWCGKRAD